jgi:hypothetical protein
MSRWQDDFTRLKEWHLRALHEGVPGAERLNDGVLRRVARSGRRSAPEIEKSLLPYHRPFAETFADILAGRTPSTTAAEEEPEDESGLEEDVVEDEEPVSPDGDVPDGDAPDGDAPDGDYTDEEIDPGPDLDALLYARYLGVDPAKTRVTCTDGPDGLELEWAPLDTDAEVVIYRVVTADDRFAPQSPEDGDLLPATLATSVLDLRPFASAVRRVLVFAHAGPSVEEAAATEPLLHAEGAAVAPVVGVHVREDDGLVVGEWTAWEGTRMVEVLRVPADRISGSGDPRYRILHESDNLCGFVDREAERGRTYRYEFVAVAAVDGVELLSRAQVVELTVSANLQPVLDLEVELLDGDDPVFDLTWTAPAVGRVVIYRSAEPPAADADREVRDESALPSAGLLPDDRLVHPTRPGQSTGSTQMRRVPWPRGMTAAWFTPVTALGRDVRVGPSVLRARTGRVEAPVIVERVHKQVVTFGWPDGAAAVLAYSDLVGRQSPPPRDAPHQIIMREAYERQGGMHLDDALPPQGCMLHLVPAAFVAGRRVDGPIARAGYGGLLRMRYEIATRRSWTGKPQTLTVWVRSELELPQPPPLALVHNPDRLPLDIGDGGRLLAVPEWNAGLPPSPQLLPTALVGPTRENAWTVSVAGRSGFVRLFVDIPPSDLARVALLDPPPGQLRLAQGPTFRARQ